MGIEPLSKKHKHSIFKLENHKKVFNKMALDAIQILVGTQVKRHQKNVQPFEQKFSLRGYKLRSVLSKQAS